MLNFHWLLEKTWQYVKDYFNDIKLSVRSEKAKSIVEGDDKVESMNSEQEKDDKDSEQ